MALGWGETGDARQFASREALKEKLRLQWDQPDSTMSNSSLAVWQMAHEMKEGDVVFAKQGRHKIIGRGIVTSDYEFVDDDSVEGYAHQRKVKWTNKGEWTYPKENAPDRKRRSTPKGVYERVEAGGGIKSDFSRKFTKLQNAIRRKILFREEDIGK